ncbi:MAG: hypothetical protein JWN70_746 [Planctomycetaceae bacterium]|nr:hypothetical protein [Planctomycetaceae bacterium]
MANPLLRQSNPSRRMPDVGKLTTQGTRQTESDFSRHSIKWRLKFFYGNRYGYSKRMSERSLSALDPSELCHPFGELTTFK